MTRPVLAVSATDDGDPYNLISRPDLRQIPWSSMPAPLKCLLILDGASHRLLAGNALMDPESPGIPQTSTATGGGKPGRRHRSGTDQLDSSRMAADGDGNNSAGTPSRRSRKGPGPSGPHAYNLRALAAMQGVSTAFLDLALKQRPEAQRWLQNEAPVWLRGTASLTIRQH
jgi:hypothetical protein